MMPFWTIALMNNILLEKGKRNEKSSYRIKNNVIVHIDFFDTIYNFALLFLV